MNTTVKYIVLIAFVLLFSGCLENRLPEKHTTNLKEQHDYQILGFQGNKIFYLDGEYIKYIKTDCWSCNYDVYFMGSNKTYLNYEKYGGLADFYQWTVFIQVKNQRD